MSVPPLHLALVFVGGGLGSCLRYMTGIWTLAWFGPHFPAGTFAVNLIGSAVMGALAAWIMARFTPSGGGNELRLFLMTGFLGGYTTFSAFSLDTFVLWERGAHWLAAGYVAATVVLSIAALVIAHLATRALIAA